MKKVLYITNIEVPYRVRFLNELARHCELTILCERRKSASRNDAWAKSEQQNFRIKYLKGLKLRGESTFSFGILKEIFSGYDVIIIGCYNTLSQMLAILAMRLTGRAYYLNLDGEQFLTGTGLKNRLKRFFLAGAAGYLVAGEKAAQSIREIVKQENVVPYYFSSLRENELQDHSRKAAQSRRNDTVLVVGQYYGYKGMDVALQVARMDPDHRYKFVGMGKRTELFARDHQIDGETNIELIPFLPKEDLEREYRTCGILLLPSRQECWGLVVNEAASFGMPIVSTWGSGAAVEFMGERYPEYLAKADDPEDLLRCVNLLRSSGDQKAYSDYLLSKNRNYSIEKSVQVHLETCGIQEES